MSRPRPEFRLPHRRRWSWWAIAISVAVNAFVFSIRWQPWLPPTRLPPSVVILLPPGSEGERVVDMPWREPGGAADRGRGAGITPRLEPVPAPAPETPVTPEQVDEPAPAAPEPADTGARPAAPRDPEPYRLGPQAGEGKLWVRPLPAPPRDIARALAPSHVELVDSAVSAIVQEYIDSVLNAPSPSGKPPSWTTQIAGKTFGLDSRYIYLGGLKIPSAILALLPIKTGNNVDLTAARRLAAIREDLQYAAQRAQTMDDFKRAIREVREERERQKELERNQRLKPPENPPEKKDTSKGKP
ncbi:MAG TPA: hypothetical protein VFN96_02290 [Gemmatimonadales bacterium]|nr:hypothetical protein [Gemmatimonadales bacterium]